MKSKLSICTGLFTLVLILLLPACQKTELEGPAGASERIQAPVDGFSATFLQKDLALKKGVGSSATVRFGDPNAGSPFPPDSGHDQSIHAADKMVPRTVVIAAGGEVHYHLAPFHQAAIYAPGTKPGDIDLTLLEDLLVPFFIPDFVINDPNDRVALSPALTVIPTMWTTPPGTFDTPGRYLVICTTFPHFAHANMYGYVIVM